MCCCAPGVALHLTVRSDLEAVRWRCFALLLLQVLAVQASNPPLPTSGQYVRGNTTPVSEEPADGPEMQMLQGNTTPVPEEPADGPEMESAEVEQQEPDSLEVAPMLMVIPVVPKCLWVPVLPAAPSPAPSRVPDTTDVSAREAAGEAADVSPAAKDAEEDTGREGAATSSVARPEVAVSVAAPNCRVNLTWAQQRVSSDAARTTVRRAFYCASQRSRKGCATEKFCNWLEDRGRCDIGVEHGVLDTLLSSILKPGRPADKEVSRQCGFAGQLRQKLADCKARLQDGSCPAHCHEVKPQCLYRSGACSRERRYALNLTEFWNATCRSDVGKQCGLTIGDWSWAWPRAGRTHEAVVSCLQQHCPRAAKFYRHLFSVQDRCSGLNVSECREDPTCFAWDALNSSICEASPEALAPQGCGFGELEAAAWRCNRRNSTACTGDCEFIEGGTCWHNDRADICIGHPSSKVPLHMSHTPGMCSLTSNAAFRVLAQALQEPDLAELARLAEHEDTCNSQMNTLDCADVPTVIGQLQMNVSDPEAFASDRSAGDAVAKGIAAMASVPRDVVSVRLTVPAEMLRNRSFGRSLAFDMASDVAGESDRLLSVAIDLAGQVNADYTIIVPAGRKAVSVAGTLTSTDNEAATAAIMRALDENNLGKTYVVEVRHIEANPGNAQRHFPVANGALSWMKPFQRVHRLLLMGFPMLVAL